VLEAIPREPLEVELWSRAGAIGSALDLRLRKENELTMKMHYMKGEGHCTDEVHSSLGERCERSVSVARPSTNEAVIPAKTSGPDP